MPDRPITIIAPVIQNVLDGICTTLRRPRGALADCRPGDRLWIREQFRLHRDHNHISPLQALERGAVPVFVADTPGMPDYAVADLGRPRFARELPRAWHRAYLAIGTVRDERLQAITDEEIVREGYETRARYAAAWDSGARFRGWTVQQRRPSSWAVDPKVLVFTFTCVAAHLDAYPTTEAIEQTL
jgi:hypothetical protein